MNYNLTGGDKFGKLTIIKKSEKKGLRGITLYDCVCNCGKPTTVPAKSITSGHTKSCGHCNDIKLGDRFGKLVIVQKSEVKVSNNSSTYECICECGNSTTVPGSRLKSGNTKSCGHCNDISNGDRFGKLVVINKSELTGTKGQSKYNCICDCGNHTTVAAKNIKCGGTKSCGHCNDIHIGDKFSKLRVISESENKGPKGLTIFKCTCDCGNLAEVFAIRLKNGSTKSCGRCTDIFPGYKFGKLTIIKKSEKKGPSGSSKFDCLCDCGNYTSVMASHLKNKHTTSCGHCPIVFVGDKFGKLTIIKEAENKDASHSKKYECLCECGKSTTVSGSSLKSGNTKSCGKCKELVFHSGDRFGKLTVVKKSNNTELRGAVKYDCICDCGETTTVLGSNLKSGCTKSCGCIRKHKDREFALIQNKYNNRIVLASKKMRLDYDLTVDDFGLMIKQTCFYCGSAGVNVHKDYDLTGGVRKISDTVLVWNGIDRVDSSLGYLKNNTVTCCIDCNRAKCDMTQDDFKSWIIRAHDFSQKISNGYKRIVIDVKPLNLIKVNFNGGYKRDAFETAIVKDLFWSKIIIRCQRRHTTYDISLDDFNTIIHQPCHYCGIVNSAHASDRIDRKTSKRRSDTVVHHNGVDRIDSSLGYSKDNIVACCWECNRAKNNRTQDEFKVWIDKVYNHFVKRMSFK